MAVKELVKQLSVKTENFLFIPPDEIILTEVIASLCPSSICVHSPAAFHTLNKMHKKPGTNSFPNKIWEENH